MSKAQTQTEMMLNGVFLAETCSNKKTMSFLLSPSRFLGWIAANGRGATGLLFSPQALLAQFVKKDSAQHEKAKSVAEKLVTAPFFSSFFCLSPFDAADTYQTGDGL